MFFVGSICDVIKTPLASDLISISASLRDVITWNLEGVGE